LHGEDPSSIEVKVSPVGEIQTNGEQWVIFQFDAPKSRAVMIHGVLAVGRDHLLYPTLTRAESHPDPSRPLDELIKAGSSKFLKVRRVRGGDWEARFSAVVPLGFLRQWGTRIKCCWRWKSFKAWGLTFIERDHPFVASEFVKTSEALVAPPQSPEISFSALLPFPPTADERGETHLMSATGRLIYRE
jgi:hypothetical protein